MKFHMDKIQNYIISWTVKYGSNYKMNLWLIGFIRIVIFLSAILVVNFYELDNLVYCQSDESDENNPEPLTSLYSSVDHSMEHLVVTPESFSSTAKNQDIMGLSETIRNSRGQTEGFFSRLFWERRFEFNYNPESSPPSKMPKETFLDLDPLPACPLLSYEHCGVNLKAATVTNYIMIILLGLPILTMIAYILLETIYYADPFGTYSDWVWCEGCNTFECLQHRYITYELTTTTLNEIGEISDVTHHTQHEVIWLKEYAEFTQRRGQTNLGGSPTGWVSWREYLINQWYCDDLGLVYAYDLDWQSRINEPHRVRWNGSIAHLVNMHNNTHFGHFRSHFYGNSRFSLFYSRTPHPIAG